MADAGDKERKTAGLEELLRQHLPGPVRLLLFTSRQAPFAAEQRRLLEELVKLSDRLSLETHDLEADAELARRHGVDKAPCTVVLGGRGAGLRFYGLTGGHELSSLLEALLMAGSARSGLPPMLEEWVRRIDAPTHVEVFVTLTCPLCPKMVRLAHQMATVNDQVRAEMVEAAEFPEAARAHGLAGVPLVVVNGRHAFHGLLPPEEAVLEIMRIAVPGVFEELEAELRAKAGARRVQPPRAEHRYDTIVVGAGPAALSAALYAARNGVDVLLVGDRLGGQVADTATVENWLGAISVGGHDLAVLFRAHVEHYALAEQLHVRVAAVERAGADFVVRLEDGKAYRGRSVVYCAGKQYRTLGVPGEARFLGRGIAFCATCDAPLFAGKRVLVVGGGNSAFTAARDLLPHAAEVHIANIAPDWQADAALREEVARHPKVRLHPATQVEEFLGKDALSGARIAPAGGGEAVELPVDGVFLEVGLTPNSGPVAALVPLNPRGEIVVDRDQSTAVPGFFAAGDVTDEPEKQIVVAEGAGAKAGLAAYRWLAATGRDPQNHLDTPAGTVA